MDIRLIIFSMGLSILGLFYMYLSYLVIRQRRKFKVAYLTNQDKDFVRRFRAHANFAEYVPFTLLLLMVAYVFQMHVWLFSILMLGLILGRFAHAYGLIRREAQGEFKYRIFGVGMNYFIILFLAIYNLVKALIFALNGGPLGY